MPVFDGFLRDNAMVRNCVFRNLSDFLRLVSSEKRTSFLPNLCAVLDTAPKMNWRVREMVARQLGGLAELLSCHDSAWERLVPLCDALLRDDVAQVRLVAAPAVPSILQALHEERRADYRVKLRAHQEWATNKGFKMVFSCCEEPEGDLADSTSATTGFPDDSTGESIGAAKEN